MDEPLVRTHELYDVEGHASTGAISNAESDFVVQKYCFSPLDIREHDGSPVQESVKRKLEPVGCIQLDFYFLENARRNRKIEHGSKIIDPLGPIDEKAVKGGTLSHAISLAEAESTPSIDIFDAEYADDGKPFASFTFQYRSHEALKSLYMIPQTSEPIDLTDCTQDVIRRSTRGDIERMFAHWKTQDEIRQQRLKRERSEDSVTVVGGDEARVFEDDDDVIFVGVGPRQRNELNNYHGKGMRL